MASLQSGYEVRADRLAGAERDEVSLDCPA